MKQYFRYMVGVAFTLICLAVIVTFIMGPVAILAIFFSGYIGDGFLALGGYLLFALFVIPVLLIALDKI